MKNNDFSQSIKEWYVKEYPNDPLGPRLVGTFGGAMQCLLSGGDFYGYVTEADSIVREHIFSKLSKMFDVDYDDIYNLWINETISITLFKKIMASETLMAKLADNRSTVPVETQKKGA